MSKKKKAELVFIKPVAIKPHSEKLKAALKALKDLREAKRPE